MRFWLSLFICVLFSLTAFATHNRAGEITYRQLDKLTYEFTIITYTKTSAPADKPALEINWGDNSIDTLLRIEKIPVASDISRNKYIGRHTFPGPSAYKVSFIDPNRVQDVINIPNSVEIPFYVETLLILNPFYGYNNSPILLNPPIDNGCLNHTYYHNPAAWDPDGDSLSYKLVKCKGEGGVDIPNYSYPLADKSFSIDPVTGDLIWDSPKVAGIYNIAFVVEEWRILNNKAVKIGYVERDMQVLISSCLNEPPILTVPPDICVLAGKSVNFNVTATDANKDLLSLSASGGPFQIKPDPATFTIPVSIGGLAQGSFNWKTTCNHVNRQGHRAVFRVQDNVTNESMVIYKTVNIKVVAPAPKNFSVAPAGNSMVLKWDKDSCANAVGYRIYRREDKYSGTIECPCTTGVPSSTGFKLIASKKGWDVTGFIDENKGEGLKPGITYCYFVTAVFKDSVESCASQQKCAQLKKDLPIITNVDILKTDKTNGEIYIAWSKPTEFDTVAVKGPYRYVIYESADLSGKKLLPVDSVGGNGLNDTIYVQKGKLNTQDTPHSYQIYFYSLADGKRFLIGKTQLASSVFIALKPSDNKINVTWNENVPWLNSQYIIYRLSNNSSGALDSLGITTQKSFLDSGLANGVNYCYLVKSIGAYSAPGLINPIINRSQIQCSAAVDNIPPCAPVLNVVPDCDLRENQLNWNNPNNKCSDDVLKYHIYYSPSLDGRLSIIDSTSSPLDTSFTHSNLRSSIAGCYLIAAVDSGGNESTNGAKVCVDNCPVYELPNIFTPNNDGLNDVFQPFPYRFVKDIKLTIYDRWGSQVFTSKDPEIKWDGKSSSTRKECTDGVYYYVCDVNEIHLEGIRTRTLKGFVTLIRNVPGKSNE